MKKIVGAFAKDLIIQMIISIILLLLASFVALKMSISSGTINIMILSIYGISTFAGGFIMGKVMGTKKFLWGAVAGMLYYAIIIMIAFGLKNGIGQGSVSITGGMMASVIPAVIGGMIS